MALKTCPECSAKVSEQAISCPNCGYPLQQSFFSWAKKGSITILMIWVFINSLALIAGIAQRADYLIEYEESYSNASSGLAFPILFPGDGFLDYDVVDFFLWLGIPLLTYAIAFYTKRVVAVEPQWIEVLHWILVLFALATFLE